MTTPTLDMGTLLEELSKRIHKLEMKITSPNYTVPNGSTPTFGGVNIGTPGSVPDAILALDPEPPTALVYSTQALFNDVSVTVSWTASPDLATVEYNVRWLIKNVNDATYVDVGTHRVGGTTHTLTDAIPGRTYRAEVSSVSTIGAVGDALTDAQFVVAAADATIPTALTNLVLTAGVSSISARWDDSTDPDVKAVGLYQIQLDDANTFASPLYDDHTTASVVSILDLTPGTDVWARVRAVDASGNNGPWTVAGPIEVGDAGATVGSGSDGLAPGSSPAATARNATGFIFVTWPRPANADPLTFEVHASSTSGFVPSSATLVTETDGLYAVVKTIGAFTIPYDTNYYFKILAKDADGPAATYGTESAAAQVKKAGTGDIASGAITAASGIIASLDAGTITVGKVNGDQIATNTLVSGHISTAGLDASVIKFGTMSGDRITANTLDVNAIKTSVLSATNITLTTTGYILGGSSAGTQFQMNAYGYKLYKNSVLMVDLNANTGDAYFKGTIAAGSVISATISANNISGGTITGVDITGVTITGGTFRTRDLGQRIELRGSAPTSSTGYNTITFVSGSTISDATPMDGYIQQTTDNIDSAHQISIVTPTDYWLSGGSYYALNQARISMYSEGRGFDPNSRIQLFAQDIDIGSGSNGGLVNIYGTTIDLVGPVNISGTALSNLYAAKSHAHSYPVSSVNSKTGAVSLDYNDVGAAWSSHGHTKSSLGIARGVTSFTTDANGYGWITHGLGLTPASVVVTAEDPYTGSFIPCNTVCYNRDATYMYFRALSQSGATINNFTVTINWLAIT